MDLQSKRQGKMEYLDGLRGLMAMNVIICHFVCVYFPEMFFLDHASQNANVLSYFATTPLSALVNGDIAVRYFFVLTGFLVGMSVFCKGITADELVKKSVLRYTRLLPVVLIATVFTFLTMVLDLQWHLDIVEQVANGEFLLDYCNFKPTASSLLHNIFIKPFLNGSDYVGPFWTMRYEFWGYILSLILCYILKDSKFRRVGYIVIAGILHLQLSPNYVPFVVGIFVADLLFNEASTILSDYYTKWFSKKWFIWACFLLGVYFATCPKSFTTFHALWSQIPMTNTGEMRSVGIGLLILVFCKCLVPQKILAFKPFVHLGDLSYEIYALHWPIMLSLQARIFSLAINYWDYSVAALVSFAATLPVIYASALLLHKIVSSKKQPVKSITRLFGKKQECEERIVYSGETQHAFEKVEE